MAWSTRELAEMAGTTVNTVRHYHRSGLLPEPDRLSNGYKQYTPAHLVRLLRIRRLADLGVPLAQISAVGSGGERTEQALREVDAELALAMTRLQRARDDIATILREGVPADSPAGFTSLAGDLSEADRSMLHVYSQLYDETALADLRQMLAADGEAGFGRMLAAVAPDADDAERQQVAELLAPVIAANIADHPWLVEPAERLTTSEAVARQTVLETIVEVYNPAQLDVLGRASTLALAPSGSDDGSPSP